MGDRVNHIAHENNENEAIGTYTPDSTQTVEHRDDKVMFSDDTGIAFIKNCNILPKLETYERTTVRNRLSVNRAKVCILHRPEKQRNWQNHQRTPAPI